MQNVHEILHRLASWALPVCLFLPLSLFARESRLRTETGGKCPELVAIPAGTFEMGDHHDLGGREHPSDEVPVHSVTIDSFQIGRTEVTTRQFAEFLNGALGLEWTEVDGGRVTFGGTKIILCETRPKVRYSGIAYDSGGKAFSVVSGREDHPAVGIRWEGAALFCNWLSHVNGYSELYDTKTWACDFSKNGFRLPTEAEWEYAARGGLHEPYRIFPWGDEPDYNRANWPRSGDPYEYGDYPWTTPAGFYNGSTHRKWDFNWLGPQERYETKDAPTGTVFTTSVEMSGNGYMTGMEGITIGRAHRRIQQDLSRARLCRMENHTEGCVAVTGITANGGIRGWPTATRVISEALRTPTIRTIM